MKYKQIALRLSASVGGTQVMSEINTIRTLLTSKPRPEGWTERRARLDEVGSVWPPAADVKFTEVDIGGVDGEWSIVPGSDEARILIYFHGGGYCSGSIRSHRRMVSEAGRAAGIRTLAIAYRLAPEHPFPAALDEALTAWRFLQAQGIAPAQIAVGGDRPDRADFVDPRPPLGPTLRPRLGTQQCPDDADLARGHRSPFAMMLSRQPA